MAVHLGRRHLAAGLTAVIAVSALAACSPSGSAPAAGSTSTKAVSIDVAHQGSVTLNMLDFWPSGAENDWMNAAVGAFEKKYPNVTIKRTSQNWGDLNGTLNLRLADAGGPDIATANQGWQALGTFAKGKLVLNLDPYVQAYGWKAKVPESILRQQEFSDDGTQMGTGSLYATPVASSSIVGVNYDRKVLDAAGVAVPTTLAQFEAACAKLKAAGKVPISFASLEPGPATALLLDVQAMSGPKNDISGFVYGNAKIKASDTGLLKAAQTVKEWAAKGWFTPNYQGIAYADSVDSFKNGQGGFQFNYSGTLSPTGTQQQDFGFFVLPQVTGGQTVGVGASRAALVISSRSAHPDAAAAFLDFLMGAKTAQLAVDNNLTPALHTGLAMPADRPEFTQEVKTVAALDKSDGYVPYFDWATSSLGDTLSSQLQTLLAGKTTPQDLVAAAQADRDKFAASK